MKTTSQLIQELQILFNSYIRLRDAGKGCICCGAHFTDAGHCFKVSTHPELRFDEMNAAGQCRGCNSEHDGSFESFRWGIIARYGNATWAMLELSAEASNNRDFKWSRSELIEKIAYYKKEVKRLKKS